MMAPTEQLISRLISLPRPLYFLFLIQRKPRQINDRLPPPLHFFCGVREREGMGEPFGERDKNSLDFRCALTTPARVLALQQYPYYNEKNNFGLLLCLLNRSLRKSLQRLRVRHGPSCVIGPVWPLGPAATLRQHCPCLGQNPCICSD